MDLKRRMVRMNKFYLDWIHFCGGKLSETLDDVLVAFIIFFSRKSLFAFGSHSIRFLRIEVSTSKKCYLYQWRRLMNTF